MASVREQTDFVREGHRRRLTGQSSGRPLLQREPLISGGLKKIEPLSNEGVEVVDLLDLLSATPTILARVGQRHRRREMIVNVQNRTPGDSIELILVEKRGRNSADEVNRVFRTKGE